LRCCTSHVWSKSPDVHPAVLTPPPLLTLLLCLCLC
jgi:hypothetical protein